MNKVRAGYKMTELGEIPIEWEVKRLEECTNKITDGSHTSPAPVEISNYKICTVANMKKYKLDLENSTNISEEDYIRLIKNGCSAERGDVLLSKDGTVGKTLVYSQSGENIVFLSSIAIIRPQKNILLGEYLNQYLQETKTLERLSNTKTGSAIKRIVLKDIKNIKIIIPKIQEQERIASILSTVDEQIDNVDALIEKNKELKKGLMQTLLTKGIGHTKFKKTEIGEIPEEWDVKKLECVFEILDSMRKPIKASDREKIEGNIPYYGASGVIDWINDYIFDEELILLGEDGENLNSRNSDLAFKISGKTWVNNHAHVFRVINKKECNIDFMVYYLEAKDYSIYIAGSAQPKITQAQCRKFLLPLPEKQEQDKIASILLESDKKIEEYENKKQKLEELKKGLMQELLTGMIRVTV